MRKLNSSVYLSLYQRLERMADGIAQHQSTPQFPATLQETVRRQLQTDLNQAREDYESHQRAADLAYDRYAALTDQIKDQLAKDDSTLRGFYGKSNPLLADFGTNVASTQRKTRSGKAIATETNTETEA